MGFLLGACGTFGNGAASGLLPSRVPRARLELANAVSGGMYAVGENLAGPAVGALLFSIAVNLPFTTDLAAFAVAVLVLGFVRGDFRAVGAPDANRRLAAEMREGIRWLWAHRPLGLLALLVGAQNLGSARTLYLVLAAEDAGTLAVWALPGLPVVVLVFFAAGFFATTWDVVVVCYRQLEVLEVLMGRVPAAFWTVGIGASPVGAALGGVLVQFSGPRVPFLAMAVTMGGALLVGRPGLGGVGLRPDPVR